MTTGTIVFPVRAWSTDRAPPLVGVETPGPFLLIDPDATAFIPGGWTMSLRPDGIAIARRKELS